MSVGYRKFTIFVTFLLIAGSNPLARAAEAATEMPAELTGNNWWIWPLALFAFCLVIGILAPLAGVGGGVLFVPLVSGFFPFHLDFVRGAGLLVAMSGALAAGPALLRRNLANLRLALPAALIASSCSIVGAALGLALPTDVIQILLGAVIIGISILLMTSKNVERPVVEKQDRIGLAFGISGTYMEESTGEAVSWKTHQTPLGLLMFIIIGLLAGMFGLGAGWANVPVLNLIMGVPLKVTTATSNFLLSMTDTTAAWVYLHNGCVVPLIAIPSVMGLMLGASIGSRILPRAKPKIIRFIVIAVLLFAGGKALLKGIQGDETNHKETAAIETGPATDDQSN